MIKLEKPQLNQELLLFYYIVGVMGHLKPHMMNLKKGENYIYIERKNKVKSHERPCINVSTLIQACDINDRVV